MKKLVKDYRESVRERVLELLWRQWDAFGVAGITPPERHYIIDPEALLLATATFGRWDPRLFDEAIDCVMLNGRFINGPRLKRMLRQYGFEGGGVMAVISSMLREKDRRSNWRIQMPERPSSQALFFFSNGRPMDGFGPLDSTFIEFGFRRGKLDLRGYSQPFDPANSSNVWLKLRAFFGNSSRVEILLYLLAKGEGYPSRIARETGYAQKSAQDTMVEMAASGLLLQTRKGREVRYRLSSSLWNKLMFENRPVPEWVPWAPLFRAIEMIWLRLYDSQLLELSSLGLTSELFMLMKQVRPLIDNADLGHLLSPERQGMGDDYFGTFSGDVDNILDNVGCGE